MPYIDEIAETIALKIGDPFEGDVRVLYRMYALLVLAKGEKTTSRDVHDAWSAFTAGVQPNHRSLVPFEALTRQVQAYDDEYRDAIHFVARRTGHDESFNWQRFIDSEVSE